MTIYDVMVKLKLRLSTSLSSKVHSLTVNCDHANAIFFLWKKTGLKQLKTKYLLEK